LKVSNNHLQEDNIPSPKYIHIYSDGGPEKWAFVVVKDNKIIHEESGVFGISVSTSNDDTESEGIFRAMLYAKDKPGNYILTTDSQAIIAKINGNVANVTRNPNIKGIQTLLKEFEDSPLPISFSIKWKKRISNLFMKHVDALCREL
jgi:ribonuclease HI